MKHRGRVLILAVLAAACGRAEPAGPPPTVDAILEAELAATGGRAAWEGIKSMRGEITMTVAGAGLEAHGTVVMRAPNQSHMHIDLAGAGSMDVGCDGRVAWSRSDAAGARILTGDEAARKLREPVTKSLDWHQDFDQVEYAGAGRYRGHPVWRVKFTSPGATKISSYDRDTHLELGYEATETSQRGTKTTRTRILDYERYGAVLQAKAVEIVDGASTARLTIDRLELNPTLPDDAFALPPDVAALPH